MWPYAISALPLQLLYKAQVEYHPTSHFLSFQLPLSLSNLRYLKISKSFLRYLGHRFHAQRACMRAEADVLYVTTPYKQ